ncbi:hypothetical protein Q0N58_12550, partial [Staphylococcus aureus]|nr:hypothetical protein [Staphylococcus aureus]
MYHCYIIFALRQLTPFSMTVIP